MRTSAPAGEDSPAETLSLPLRLLAEPSRPAETLPGSPGVVDYRSLFGVPACVAVWDAGSWESVPPGLRPPGVARSADGRYFVKVIRREP